MISSSYSSILCTLLPVAVAISVVVISNYVEKFRKKENQYCSIDFINAGKETCAPICEEGSFSLIGMESCIPLLSCDEIARLKTKELIGQGLVKKVYLSEWNSYPVVINKLSSEKYNKDFHYGLKMLIKLQNVHYVTQVLGWCNDTFITEHHQLGSANQFHQQLGQIRWNKWQDSAQFRLGMCMDYARKIDFLHRNPHGTFVMCDSNDLEKALSQILIARDFHIILNDLDALPDSSTEPVRCGNRSLAGHFVAPEQRGSFNYDHRTDIWKIPIICEFFLQDHQHFSAMQYQLYDIHGRCKSTDPYDRPTAREVYMAYQKIISQF